MASLRLLSIVLAGLLLTAQTPPSGGTNFVCSGTRECGECHGVTTTASCRLEGNFSGPTTCQTFTHGNQIDCTISVNQQPAVTITSTCLPCIDSGSPLDGGGQFCDPIIPYWWVFCDSLPSY